MKSINLSRWRRRVVIGSAAHIRIEGDAVERGHVEIARERVAGALVHVLRPRDGRVTVRRGGRELAVIGEWYLADGDVLLIGCRRATYRNLASRPQPAAQKGDIAWLQ